MVKLVFAGKVFGYGLALTPSGGTSYAFHLQGTSDNRIELSRTGWTGSLFGRGRAEVDPLMANPLLLLRFKG